MTLNYYIPDDGAHFTNSVSECKESVANVTTAPYDHQKIGAINKVKQ